jgi:hypothetical protein
MGWEKEEDRVATEKLATRSYGGDEDVVQLDGNFATSVEGMGTNDFKKIVDKILFTSKPSKPGAALRIGICADTRCADDSTDAKFRGKEPRKNFTAKATTAVAEVLLQHHLISEVTSKSITLKELASKDAHVKNLLMDDADYKTDRKFIQKILAPIGVRPRCLRGRLRGAPARGSGAYVGAYIASSEAREPLTYAPSQALTTTVARVDEKLQAYKDNYYHGKDPDVAPIPSKKRPPAEEPATLHDDNRGPQAAPAPSPFVNPNVSDETKAQLEEPFAGPKGDFNVKEYTCTQETQLVNTQPVETQPPSQDAPTEATPPEAADDEL